MKLFVKENQEAGKKVVVIFSSERYDKSLIENNCNYEAVYDHLKQHSIPFSIGQGSYKGDKEPSFICVPRNNQDCKIILAIAQLYSQESVLFRTTKGIYLHYLESNKTDRIGSKLSCVSKEEAMKCDSYTKHLDKYFIVK